MTKLIKIIPPLRKELAQSLKVGEEVLISGVIYTARDTAHKRLINLIKEKEPLPFPLKDEIIYYTGPTPAKPPRPIGSCGPTTSFRMDSYTPLFLSRGLRGMIGKGSRSPEIRSKRQEVEIRE